MEPKITEIGNTTGWELSKADGTRYGGYVTGGTKEVRNEKTIIAIKECKRQWKVNT